MASRSGRLNAGMLAALGTSLALHVGLAAMLFARLPPTSDAGQDIAVSVSIAAPDIEASGAVPGSSATTAPSTEIVHSVAALASAAAAPAAAEPAAEIAASSPSLTPALHEAAPTASIAETPQRLPVVPAFEAPVLEVDKPVTPMVGAVPTAPVADAAPTARLLSPPPQAPKIAVAPRAGTTLASTAMAVASVGADAAKPLAARETIAIAPAIVAATAGANILAAKPPGPSDRIQEGAVGSSHLPRDATSVAPSGMSADVVTATVPPNQGMISAETRPEPPSNNAPSLASEPQRLAQAAHLPASALMAHEETEAERVHIIQSFIARYDGGPCFLMAPASHVTSELDIDGFATDRDKIHRFDDGFKEATGREARVVGQWISQKQCAAVDFLRAAKHGAQDVKIEIEHRDLRNGDVLSGTIDGAGPEPIRLYWIAETGSVNDISDRVQDRGERKTFDMPVRRDIVGGPYPQLLVAIVGDGWPVPAGETLKAEAFFASIEASVLRTHRTITASGKPFRLLP